MDNGIERELEDLNPYIIFRKHKSKSDGKGNVIKYDVRKVIIDVGVNYEIVLHRNDQSKNRLNEDTLMQYIALLNHFSCYLEIEPIRNSWKAHFGIVMVSLDNALNTNSVEAHCNKQIEENPSLVYRDVALQYFLETINAILVEDDVVLEMINSYIRDITFYSLDENKGNNNTKLEKEDIHIILVMGVYLKLIHLFHYRVSVPGKFIDMIAPLVVNLLDKINKYTQDYIYPENYTYLDITFMDRIYSFLEDAAQAELKRHSNNINKFSSVGISNISLINDVLFEFISSMARVRVGRYTGSESRKEMFSDFTDFYKFGFTAKEILKYFQNTKKNAIDNKIGKINTSYVLQTHSSNSSDDATSETTRFEIYLENTNKGVSELVKSQRDYTIKNILDNLEVPELVDVIFTSTTQTLLNKTIVSIFLEKYHDIDTSDIMNHREFSVVLTKIHLKLKKYPKLALAIVGKEYKGVNSIVIKEEDIPQYLKNNNIDRIKKTITDIVSKEYLCSTGDTVSPHYNIKDELLTFLKNGCVFE